MYISIDGNDVGKHLEGLILNGDLEELHVFSERISSIIDSFEKFIIEHGGKCYLRGGDNILAYIPKEEMDGIVKYISSITTEDVSFSIGIGDNVTDAYLSLKYAKSMKKGYIYRKEDNNYHILSL